MDETTVRNIVKEIIRECTHKEMDVSESFISYYVRLLIMDPAWEIITDDFLLERNALQKFITYVIAQLQHEKCPCLMVLRMQKYFMCNFDRKERKAALNHRKSLKEKLQPLETEILNADNDSHEELDKVYKKIVYYITLLSGLGNPTFPVIFKEAFTALNSIFSVQDCAEFLYGTTEDKTRQLMEFTELTSGIRLFNRDCKKGGKGIEDLPKIMVASLDITQKELQHTLVDIMDYINLLTTSIDYSFKIEKKTQGFYLACMLPKDVDVEDLNYAKDMLVFQRQYEIYVRQFLAEVENIEKNFNELIKDYNVIVEKLHEVCSFRTAIPVYLVYPHFKDVANTWCRIQDEIFQLANLNQVLINIQSLAKDLFHNTDQLQLMLQSRKIVTDAQRLKITPQLTAQMMESRQCLLDPNNIKNFDKIHLQYLGFCAWKFVEMQGALIPGNPNMGVAKIKNKYFVFSNMEAAIEFCREPQRYITEGLLILRQKPELINLLQMNSVVIKEKDVKGLKFESRDLLVTYNVSCQTESDLPAGDEEEVYFWNVWDLKRQAIMLANMSKAKSKSSQTEKAGSKASIRLQTWDPKEKLLQTKIDNYTNVPTLSNYIYGLRGRKDDKQFLIELTRPIDE